MTERLVKFPPESPEQRLLCELMFLSIAIIIFGVFGRYASIDVRFTVIITIFVVINLIIRFLLIWEKSDWIFFLFGVLVGGGNDLLSMINGVYDYTAITIIPDLKLPIFMWLFWGQVFLLFRKAYNIKWFRGEGFKKEGEFINGWVDKKLIFDIILLIILRIVIYNSYDFEFWIPAFFYAVCIGIRFIIFPPKKNELLIISILPYAFMFEGLMVTFGLYIYYNPIFLGLPLWLFLWWIFLVPFVLKEFFDRLEFIVLDKKKS